MSIESLVNYFKTKDLSGVDIQNLTGRAPVLYTDLKKFQSVNELLGAKKYVIILYQTSSITTGHFVCLRENDKNEISFFDSYGFKYDSEQHFGARFDLNVPHYLTQLIEKDGRPCDYNKFDFQRKRPNVATCGRWSSIAALWKNLAFDEIRSLMTNNPDPWLNDYDNIATILTVLPIHNIRDFFQRKTSLSIPMGKI